MRLRVKSLVIPMVKEVCIICKIGVFDVYKGTWSIENTGLDACCVAAHFYDIKTNGVGNYE